MKPWLRAGISVGVLGLLLTLLPWSEVRQSFSKLSAGVWLGVLAFFLLGHGFGVAKWRLMLRTGGAVLRYRDAARFYSAGLFANLSLPSIVGGDVLRAVLAGRWSGRLAAAVWGGVADRTIDVLALGVLLTGGVLSVRHELPGRAPLLILLVMASGLAVGFGVLLALNRRPLKRWPRRMRRPIARSLVALRRLRRSPTAAMAALAVALGMQTGFVLLNAWIGRAIGVDISLGVWFLAWPLAKVAGLAPISLGGLGVRDATLAGLLAPFGVQPALGFVASLIWQTVLIAGGLVGGLAWWLLSMRAGEHARLVRA